MRWWYEQSLLKPAEDGTGMVTRISLSINQQCYAPDTPQAGRIHAPVILEVRWCVVLPLEDGDWLAWPVGETTCVVKHKSREFTRVLSISLTGSRNAFPIVRFFTHCLSLLSHILVSCELCCLVYLSLYPLHGKGNHTYHCSSWPVLDLQLVGLELGLGLIDISNSGTLD